MRIDVDYYPEHWDRSLWEADADLMKETENEAAGTDSGNAKSEAEESASEETDRVLSKYPAYTMIYFWSSYFSICSMWLRSGKKETPQQMYEIISYMNKL